MTMHRFALIILIGFFPGADTALATDEKAKSIDEQLWDAVAAQDRALAAKLLQQGAD